MPPGTTLSALEKYSFSDQAARRVQAVVQGSQISYVQSFGHLWEEIGEGKTGIVPFESSVDGVVWPNLDKLREGGRRIVAEIDEPIAMCVGGRDGVTLESATMACSYEKGIGQSQKWLSEHPRLQANAKFNSTVDAARFVAEHEEVLAVALASRLALEHHGLTVLDTNINKMPSGKSPVTRMFLVQPNGHDQLPNPELSQHAAVTQFENYDGSLHDALGIIRQAAGLSSIQSRPIGHQNGDMQYQFFLKMAKRNPSDPDSTKRFRNMVTALEALVGKENILWLGSWDRTFDVQS
jgi:prephenate dehydratase